MKLTKYVEQLLLGPVYALLMWLRAQLWRLRRPKLIGVRALIVRGDAVLLIRHRAGRRPWSLPGGGVERYERLEEAARREAREETGVLVRTEWLLGMYDRFGQGVSNYVAVFVCTALGEPQPPRSLEIAEARFFPLDRLPAMLDAGARQRIAEYLSSARGVTGAW